MSKILTSDLLYSKELMKGMVNNDESLKLDFS